MLYNLGIIIGAVVLADRWGVNGLAVGVVLGAGMHLGIQVPGVLREGFRYRPVLGWSDPAVAQVGRLMAPRVVGLAAAQVNFVVTGYFASRVGASAISNMTYAWLLAGLPLALFGMALSTAVFPRLAGQVAREDLEALAQTVSRVLRLIMFMTVPAAIGLALLREPATITLLERGAFTRADSLVTAEALGWYCLGIVPQAGIEIHSRGFYALGDTRTPVIFAVTAVVTNLLLGAFLWQPYGVKGLAFAVSASAWVEWLGLYAFYLRRTGWSPAEELADLARIAVAGGVMGVAVALAVAAIGTGSGVDAAIAAAAGVGAGATTYAAMSLALGIPEMTEVTERVVSRLRPGRPGA
jgi:putative peptidoglycan lipid II flippase